MSNAPGLIKKNWFETQYLLNRDIFRSSLLTLIISSSYSQPSTLTLYSLSESSGLSDNRVTSLLQDHRGFMWIGTEDGLNLYDGSIFKIFRRRKNDTTGLADNFIHSIAEDVNHHLWIGTQNGLSEYIPSKNIFISYQCNFPIKDINVMMAVWPDNKGSVWIATLGGLLQFIPDQNKFTSYLIHRERISDNRIRDILVDKKGRFWVATFYGLWRFYPSEARFERIVFGRSPDDVDLINTMIEGHDGRIWLGYWSLGLRWYDPDSGESKRIAQPDLPSNVEGIAEVRNPQGHFDVWYADLFKVNEQQKITTYSISVNPQSSSYHVAKLYHSVDGLLWLCSDKGAMIMDPIKQFFHHYHFPKQITYQGIAFQQKDEKIYAGGMGQNFLKLYDSVLNPVKSYPLSPHLFSKNTPALLSIVRENENQIWLCTEDGLVLLNEQTGNQQLFRLNKNECDVATRNFISSIFIDTHGDHWVFPWRGGIWKFDLRTRKFTRQIEGLSREGSKTKALVVASAAEDSQGNIWFADLDEGMILYNRSKQFFSKPTEKAIQSRYTLNNIRFERPYIWAVTNGIIFRVHERTGAVEQWPIPEELNKSVTGTCRDLQNHIWIATRSGLLSFDEKSHQFKHFTVNDGLIDNVMTGTLFCLKNGKIIYGDNNYFTVFDPRELIKPTAVPSVVITQALSQNQPIEIRVDNTLKKNVNLDYTFNNFTFDWAVLHFSNPLQNRYYCKLEGIDPDWKYVGNTGRVHYASLSPGRYVFKARGATSDGIMNESGDELLLIIRAPFWRSWWFISVCGFGFAGLTYGWYRYRLTEVLKTERLRNRISADLHDEIGSTLSSISIMSDLVIQKTSEGKTLDVANEIRENAIVLMERMDDIVWSINPKNDSMENLLLRIKRFASQLFEAKNIEYEIQIQHDVKQMKLPMESRQHIYLILKEALNNLVKHSKCSKASIEVIQEQSMLNLLIKDNGLGFSVSDAHAGNGVASMKNRAAAMRMQLQIISKEGHGTTVQLRMKIK